MKSIAVVLTPEAARVWHGLAARKAGAQAVDVGALKDMVERLGIRLTPVHPDPQHEMLLPYFTAGELPDERAQAVVEELRRSPLVDGAYVQPTPAPPQD